MIAHTNATDSPHGAGCPSVQPKRRRPLSFTEEQWILNEPVSPFSWISRESGGAAKVNFNIPGSLSVPCPHHIFIISSSFHLFFSVNSQRTSKWGKGRGRFLSGITVWCDTWTGGRENSHTSKSVPFCLQQPKMDSFFPLLLCIMLKAGESGESLKSWHNESERGESECEGDGRAVKV